MSWPAVTGGIRAGEVDYLGDGDGDVNRQVPPYTK